MLKYLLLAIDEITSFQTILEWATNEASLRRVTELSLDDFANDDGVRLQRRKEDPPLFLFRETRIKAEFANSPRLRDAMEMLKTEKRLRTEGRPGIYTKQFKYGDGSKPRFYCFLE